MGKRIIVGYDGSGPSREAIAWAAAEAETRSVGLHLISCYHIHVAGDAMYAWALTDASVPIVGTTENSVAQIRNSVADTHPGLEITTNVSAGPAGQILVDEADPDGLIVVGASSHEGAVAAFWLGSTARWVVRHSQCPVVVVRGAASRGCPDRIVVGVDGSPASLRALQWAGDEADRHQVNLVVVHGWSYSYLSTDSGSSQGRDLTRIDAACLLDRAVESAREQFGADVCGRLLESTPVSALLEAVRDGDLLVLGSRGHGAVREIVFGSTVNSVLDRCAVPVVVVP